jgi:hypothetical protein
MLKITTAYHQNSLNIFLLKVPVWFVTDFFLMLQGYTFGSKSAAARFHDHKLFTAQKLKTSLQYLYTCFK